MATYKTQIQWGGPDAAWHDDHDLTVVVHNREAVVPADRLPSNGTQISWAGQEGNASITFFDDGARFQGAAQFKGEGPVGYRGQVKR